ISDAGVESIFTTASSSIVSLQTPTPIMTPYTVATITTSSDAPIPPTTIPSIILKNIPTFNSAFRFDERLRIEESVNATLGAEVLTRSSHSSRTSYAIAADLSEMELKKILIEKMEGNKSIQRSDEQRNLYKALVEASDTDKAILDTYGESTILKRRREDDDQEGPSAEEKEGSIHQLALHLKQLLGVQADLPQGLNLDNCLPVSLLLQRNLCRLPVRWRNPHIRCLKQPLSLILDNRGRRVIPFEHFINNDLEYLWGGASSRKYTTSVTKTKAADYGHIKWIEDLVPRATWIQEPINYDRHALWEEHCHPEASGRSSTGSG
nr:hypothetical protein [Tanacetum cinerariifolium]